MIKYGEELERMQREHKMADDKLREIQNANREFCSMSNLEKDRKLHDFKKELYVFKNWREIDAVNKFKKVDDFLATFQG